jgi:hypothetical protein
MDPVMGWMVKIGLQAQLAKGVANNNSHTTCTVISWFIPPLSIIIYTYIYHKP